MVIKQRSPNYPGLDLNTAVERTKQLYVKVQRGEFTAADAATAWGYNSVSGPVRRGVGALRQYGLLEQKKGDNAKITNRGLTIVLRNAASNEYKAAVQGAALDPPLFAELYNNGKYQAAPDALLQYLVVEKQFTNEGATRFIDTMKATMALANLQDSDNQAGLEDAITESEREQEVLASAQVTGIATPQVHVEPGTRAIQIPLSGTSWATLNAAFPMTATAWQQMMDMLTAMKPGLVAEPGPAPVSQPETAVETEDEEDGDG